MKKVVTIHLSGRIFQIEEDAYLSLEQVLCRLRLQDPVRCDSFELELADLFQSRIELGQKVVTLQVVCEILKRHQLTPDFSERPSSARNGYQRLTRDKKDKVLGGVCSGLGNYWGIDPVLFRLLFVVLLLGFGVGVLMYIIMWIIIPLSTND